MVIVYDIPIKNSKKDNDEVMLVYLIIFLGLYAIISYSNKVILIIDAIIFQHKPHQKILLFTVDPTICVLIGFNM